MRKVTPAGVVTTVAGAAGNTGSTDGPAASARFNTPRGIAADGASNLYIADTNNYTIRKITPAGTVSTLAGSAGFAGIANGTGSQARFRRPRGIAVNSANEIFVADETGQTIRKVTASGVVITFAGTSVGVSGGPVDGNGTAARFNAPRGVSVDAAGNVYVADAGNGAIRRITPAADVTTLAGSGTRGSADGTSSAASFNFPAGVAAAPGGDVLVADTSNCLIRRVTAAGVTTTLAGSRDIFGSADGDGAAARFNFTIGVATDSTGNVYVGDSGNRLIRKITPTGSVASLTNGSSASLLVAPSGVVVDGNGSVLVANYGASNIVRVSPVGEVTYLTGGGGPGTDNRNGPAGTATFSNPYAIARDAAGNAYVADPTGHVARKAFPDGSVNTIAGSAIIQEAFTSIPSPASRPRSPCWMALPGSPWTPPATFSSATPTTR